MPRNHRDPRCALSPMAFRKFFCSFVLGLPDLEQDLHTACWTSGSTQLPAVIGDFYPGKFEPAGLN